MTTHNIDLYQRMTVNLCVMLLAFNMVGCAAVQQAGDPYAQAAGFVEPVRWSAVYQGLREALLGNTRSLIMFNQNNQMLMVAWPRAAGWAWIVLDTKFASAANAIHQAGGQGNLMSCADFSCLMRGAEKIGYRQVVPADLLKLAPAFCQSVLQQSAAFASSALTSIVVMPIGVAPADPWAEVVQ